MGVQKQCCVFEGAKQETKNTQMTPPPQYALLKSRACATTAACGTR
jgi:hypothetical protein